MSTTFAVTNRNKANWYVVDASQEILGRMSARIAEVLQGKHKPEYTAHADTGDFVVVVNAKAVQVTGRKADDKFYRHYTGNHGGLRTIYYPTMLERKPIEIIRIAVRRMLPKTALGRHMLSKLKVYAGAEHRHACQNPLPLVCGRGRDPAKK